MYSESPGISLTRWRGRAHLGRVRKRPTAIAVPLVFSLALAACGSSGESAPGFSQAAGGAGAEAGPDGVAAGGSGGSAVVDAGSEEQEAAPAKLGPPYPIVLSHGFFGFNKFAGLDFATYFYQVKDYLAQHGETQVYTPAVDPFNDSTYRGAQLADDIHQILEQTGYAKVNIIGHSQGGLDARVVAHDHPDWVASVVTYATPNEGTKVADVVLKLISDPNAQAILDALVKVVGAPLYDQVGNQTSLSKPMKLFSQSGIAAFNKAYPDAPGVSYYSIAGRTDLSLGGSDCDVPDAPAFITDFAKTRDPVDVLLKPTNTLLDEGLSQVPNDGLVQVKSARWGTFLGCVPADHLDEIGQLFGDNPGLGNDWRHKEFFLALIQYLRAQGF